MVTLVAEGKLMQVGAKALEEILLRASTYGHPHEPDGVDLLIHRLLEFLKQEGEGKALVGLAGEDWLELEALVSVDREELQELTDTLENDEVARILWEGVGKHGVDLYPQEG